MRFFGSGTVLAKWLPLIAVLLLLLTTIADAAAIPNAEDQLVERSPTKKPKASKATTPTKASSAPKSGSSTAPKPVTSSAKVLNQPTVAQIEKYFKTKDSAVFWCGQVAGKSVGKKAETYANGRKPTKGVVVAQLVRTAKKDKAWKADWTTLANKNDKTIWGTFSKAFAEGAVGEVEVYWGDCVNPEGGEVWRNIEVRPYALFLVIMWVLANWASHSTLP